MEKLLKKGELPSWFHYPPEFLRIVDQGLLDFNPWIILLGDQLKDRFQGVKARYPARELVPFARREDNDDIACWDRAEYPAKVFVIHDYASPGYEQKTVFNNFWDWFKNAIEIMIEHEP